MQRIYNRKLNFWGHVQFIAWIFIIGELIAARWLGFV